MDVKVSRSKEAVAAYFSEYLAHLIRKQGETHIALSGGSTPKIVFDLLAEEYKDSINWSDVHLYWGDERCVPPDDDQSNYKMTVTHLLSKIEIPEDNIHRILGETEPEAEADRYGELLSNFLPEANELPQFDLVILGMGDDGHTASVFPHEIQLWDSEKNCEVAIHPESGQRRVTITGKLINNAREVAFLVTGGSKAEKVKAILHKEKDYEQYPAALVNPQSGKLYWFLDSEAAKLVTSG
ncbi:6-phosphogluconolactonase [Poritiphilus flavus]|uniref:6-phosphogluconolactonase n=1 Tax=Poritiphilus flavus TaxID=2697053 RepID=A0A6L9EB88_9FLAO|nr:6-phosphogluconolactonase [Poritiphilus flavus]NAS11689.1 6-phosphogluconolactonase [Poritiphilus flavus]